MKQKTRFVIFAIGAILLLMVISLAVAPSVLRSVAASDARRGTPGKAVVPEQDVKQQDSKVIEKGKPAARGEDREEDIEDPDIPRIARRRMGKAAYLALRSEHIATLRGFEKGKDFDPMRRATALRQMEQQIANAPQIAIGSWTEVGPAPIPNGQTQTTTTAVSGRVSAIAVHPTDPNKLYVGTAGGGLYRSLDGGATWTALMDSALSLSIGAVTIDPTTSTTVWVGTGEANTGSGNTGGVGIYRIINAETTPTLQGPFSTRVAGCGTTASTGIAFDRTAIAKIIFDPNDNNRMFVGNELGLSGIGSTSNGVGGSAGFIGLFLSANAQSGTPTFSRCSGAPGGGTAAIKDIAFEPGSSSNMVFSLLDRGGAGNDGIYRSTDANAATVSPSASLTATRTHMLAASTDSALAINKIGATVTVVAGTGTSNGRVLVSTDGGATFPTTLATGNGFCGGQCFYDLTIALDPADSNRIYIGGAGQSGSSRIFGRTTDGANFSNSANGLHADSHAIAIAPSNSAIIYTGNDGGVFKSTDSGATWASVNTNGFGATQFISLSTHPIDREFAIGGTQDNGTNFKQANSIWTRADFGDGGYSGIDQNATDTTNVRMYHTYFNISTLAGYGTVSNTASASDGNWTFRGCNGVAGNGINCGDTAVLFYAPLTLGPGNPNPVYFGTDRLYRSADNGSNHTIVSQGPLVPGVAISAIGIAANSDNVRAVGLRNGQLFRTASGSATLDDVTGSLPATFISRIAIDTNNNNIAYVTLATFRGAAGQNVWKTTNFLAATPTWAASGTGIPDVPTNAFVINPTDSTKLYAGTDIGVYRSTDSGATWTAYSTSLPRVPIFDLKFQGDSAMQLLRAATHGRGFWEISDTAATTCASTALSSGGNWSSISTWGCGRVPTAADSVVIVNGQNVTLDVNPLGASITVNAGGTLTVSGNRTLSSNLTVAGTLALSGILTAGGNTVAVTNCSAGAITGGSPASHINSSLQRCVSSGGTYNFPVGNSGYTPVALSNIVGTNQNFTVSTTNTAPPITSGAPPAVLNRTWQLTNGGITSGDVLFNYLDGDLPGATTESTLAAYRIDSGVANNMSGTVNTGANTLAVPNVGTFSPWTLGGQLAPTAVKVNEFQGYRFNDGNLVRWQSSFETQNLGFHVYRQIGKERVRVTPEMVAGSALRFGAETVLNAGFSYTWFDAAGSPDSVYWVEDTALDGKTAMHGPIKLTPCENAQCAFAEQLRPQSSALLNQISSGGDTSWQKGAPADYRPFSPQAANTPGTDAWQQQLRLAGQGAVKIRARQNGWYRVSGAQLQAAGLPAAADAALLQLYVDGAQQAMSARTSGGGESGALGSAGYIEFYATGADERETDARTYWLISGTERGLRLGAPVRAAPGGGNGKGGAAPTPSSFNYTIERKEKTIYVSSLLNGEAADNFFGTVVATAPGNQTLTVNKLGTGATGAVLEVSLQGFGLTAHRVDVKLNGQSLGEVTYVNQAVGMRRFDVPAGLLVEGNNTITMQGLGGNNDVSITNYLRLTYPHRYEAENDQLVFTGGRNVAVSGFTSGNVRVFDINEPGKTFEVAARFSGDTLNIPGRLDGRALLAVGESRYLAPAEITANVASTWTNATRAADFLIITPREFRSAVEPLANARRGQGLATEVISVEDIYDEWSGGEKDVNSLRGFFQWARTNWATPPRYVLLVGDASFDPRNYLALGNQDYIPTGYVATYQLETSSDEILSDTNNDGIGELVTGRLPARTVVDVEVMVDKIVNYRPNQIANGAILVSDRNDGYNFTAMSQEVRQYIPANLPVTMINREGNPDADVRAQILASFQAGPMLINYFGHGSAEVWTGAGLLRSSDAPNLTNGNRLPVLFGMTCLNGYFHDLTSESLAEALVKARNGGAVATWMSSALTFAPGQQAMGRQLYQYIFQGGASPRLGDAITSAKNATFDLDVRRAWLLFGDPTMPMR